MAHEQFRLHEGFRLIEPARPGDNAALAFPTFKDWSQRDKTQSAEAETAAINAQFAANGDGAITAVMPPPIDGLGNSGGFALRLMDRGGLGREALLAARDQLLARANICAKDHRTRRAVIARRKPQLDRIACLPQPQFARVDRMPV